MEKLNAALSLCAILFVALIYALASSGAFACDPWKAPIKIGSVMLLGGCDR